MMVMKAHVGQTYTGITQELDVVRSECLRYQHRMRLHLA